MVMRRTEHPWPLDRCSLERDCEVEFFKSGGPGGQHRNKRITGVRLRHQPTGVVVSATERRSRQRNLDVAFERMARRLEGLQGKRAPRKPTKPSRFAVERRLSSKRRVSVKKARRRPPGPWD